MLYYIFPYLFLLTGAWILNFYNFQKKLLPFLLFLFLMPAFFLVILRGNIGTDTIQYVKYFSKLSYESMDKIEFEPGFAFLASIINLVGFNDHIDVAIIGIITITLLCKSYSTSPESILIFSTLIFPFFFYDMTMNGLRYGLGFALSTIAIDALYRKKNLTFIITSLVAISIQYSSGFIVFTFIVFKLEKKFLLLLAIFLVCYFSLNLDFFANNLKYLYDKQDVYKDLVSPSITSGLGPLFLFSILCIYFVRYSSDKRSSILITFVTIFEFASFALAKVSYAGLRFQSLFLFILIVLIKQEYQLINNKKVFSKAILLIGLLGFIFTIKNITTVIEDVDSASPYIPYKFYWQE